MLIFISYGHSYNNKIYRVVHKTDDLSSKKKMFNCLQAMTSEFAFVINRGEGNKIDSLFNTLGLIYCF